MPFENNRFLYYFFAPQERFDACGMFTIPHITAAVFLIVLAVFLLVLYKHNKLTPDLSKLTRTFAILITTLEIIKISHSFIYGDLHLDAWFPLSYCGLFIFALWMSGFGTEKIKSIGKAFIAYGCPFAGVAFIVFPTTSLMSFPIWHYFSLYSLFFHFSMIYIGVLYLFNSKDLDRKIFTYYALFVLIFALPAISLNCCFNSNLMNLREPYNIPIQIIQDLYAYSGALYTAVVLVIYMLIPFVVALLGNKLKQNEP